MGDYAIHYVDTTTSTPVIHSLNTFPERATTLATDGVNVYTVGYYGSIYQVSLAAATLGTFTTMVTGAGGGGVLATDGINLYVANSNNLYRIPIGTSNGTLASYEMASSSSLPMTSGILSVQVDATSVYFANQTDVFKMKK
jgi:hypothetical protein